MIGTVRTAMVMTSMTIMTMTMMPLNAPIRFAATNCVDQLDDVYASTAFLTGRFGPYR